MLNQVCICGRLTKDVMLQQVGETVKAGFCLAVNRNYKDGNGEYPCDFLDCVAWGATASFLESYSGKGDMLTVSGRIQKDLWKDKEGNTQSRTYVNADSVNIVAYAGRPDQEPEEPEEPAKPAPKKKTTYKRR